jgi:glycosyltransferase involved in cell wall biosynthesis
MNIGVILPHCKLSGGVKRFFELGTIFVEKGHSFTVYTPNGEKPDWIDSKIKTGTFEELAAAENEMLFTTDRKFKEILLRSKAKYKIFYHVSLHHKSRKMVLDRRLFTFACSTNVWQYDRTWFRAQPFLAAGGINLKIFYPRAVDEIRPDNTFTILIYGRVSDKIKGTMLAVRACEKLYEKYPQIRLILFDTPLDEKMDRAIAAFHSKVPFSFIKNHPICDNAEIFHKASLFVGVEKGAGWSNTVAEAMACGIPVVATTSGTRDFLFHNRTGIVVNRNVKSISQGIERAILAPEECKTFAINARKEIEKYEWPRLAERILAWHEEMEGKRTVRPS